MKTHAKPITVLIADDHPVFLDGYKLMFKSRPDLKLIGEATNGEELVALAKTLSPDVIVTDILMPKMDGIQATKQLIEEVPDIKIIALY